MRRGSEKTVVREADSGGGLLENTSPLTEEKTTATERGRQQGGRRGPFLGRRPAVKQMAPQPHPPALLGTGVHSPASGGRHFQGWLKP